MAVVITRDVEPRYRGFLSSIMLELAPGVYAHPNLSAGVRSRVYDVLGVWYGHLQRGSIVMTWVDKSAPGGLGLLTLGEPSRDIFDHDAVLLVRREIRRS